MPMRMRSVVAGVVLAGLVAVLPVSSRAEERTPGSEFGLAMGAAAIDLGWVPVKLVTAGLGLAVGSVAGVLTGGDVRTAYAVWVPTTTGTFIVTPANLDGTEPLQFFGDDYADRPSTVRAIGGSGTYEAAYFSR
jgi:hypothetical protein